METAALLKKLGFAEYEARAYLALLQRNPLNGYELAKLSGVPRADIYSVLQRLEERGAVLRLEEKSGTRFSPAPPDEVIGRLERTFQQAAEEAKHSLEQVKAPIAFGEVLNVEGRAPLLEHARALVDSATSSVLLALGPEESAALEERVLPAQERGVSVTTLCPRACPVPCGHCHGHLFRHQLAPESSGNWLIVVRDDEEVVAGLVSDDGEAAGIRTGHRLVVDLATWQLRHGVALAALLDDLGPGLEEQLRPATRKVLGSVGPGTGQGWLEYMRLLASGVPAPRARGKRRESNRRTDRPQ